VDRLQRERFTGFSEQYDKYRPSPPIETISSLVRLYRKSDLETVADIGCGTGLSTLPWAGYADHIIGIEPNQEMVAIAKQNAAKALTTNVSFIEAASECIPIGDCEVDLVTCSQSFHWMEPLKAVAEFARILRAGGMVAVYDCDWPPSVGQSVETSFTRIVRLAKEVLERNSGQAKQWSKLKHLQNLEESGYFQFTKELCFHEWIKTDSQHIIGMIESQGAVQQAIKADDSHLVKTLEDEKQNILKEMGVKSRRGIMSYRMRIAIK